MLRNEKGQSTAGSILLGLFAVIVIAVLAIGTWQLGWFVAEKDTDRQVQIDNRNKGTQTAWHDEVVKTIADYQLVDPANTAARGALRNKACDLIPRLTETYRDSNIVAFESQEC